MNTTQRYSVFLLVLVSLVLCSGAAVADQLRYMDEAGNIRFVNRMKEVPREYREQIVPPTPTPVLDHRQRMDLLRRQQEEAIRRQRQERMRQMEEQQRRQQAEQMRLRYERERLSVSGQDRIHRGGP
jgi:hypothetical protein